MRGMNLIVLTGIDGSGKTTLARSVVDHLIKEGVDAVYVHGRPRLILSRPLASIGRKVLLTRSNTDDYEAVTHMKRGLFERHPLLRRLYETVLLFDALLQLWATIGVPLARGRTVVSDRYYYDTVITDASVDMNYSEVTLEHRMKILRVLLPRPSMIFLIDIDEELAASRKSDIQSLEYLRDRRKCYLLLAHVAEVTVLDGSMNRKALFEECIGRINDGLYN